MRHVNASQPGWPAAPRGAAPPRPAWLRSSRIIFFFKQKTATEIIGDEDKRKQFDRGEIDAEGKPRFQGFSGGGFPGGGFPGGDPRGRAGASGFETHTFRSGGGGNFEDILNSMFGGAAAARGARPGAGTSHTFEFDPGGIALHLHPNVTLTGSLEEARERRR